MLYKMEPRDEVSLLRKKETTRDDDKEEVCECNCQGNIKPNTIKSKGKSILVQVQSLLLMVLTMSKEQAIEVLDKFETHLIDFIEQIKRGEF